MKLLSFVSASVVLAGTLSQAAARVDYYPYDARALADDTLFEARDFEDGDYGLEARDYEDFEELAARELQELEYGARDFALEDLDIRDLLEALEAYQARASAPEYEYNARDYEEYDARDLYEYDARDFDTSEYSARDILEEYDARDFLDSILEERADEPEKQIPLRTGGRGSPRKLNKGSRQSPLEDKERKDKYTQGGSDKIATGRKAERKRGVKLDSADAGAERVPKGASVPDNDRASPQAARKAEGKKVTGISPAQKEAQEEKKAKGERKDKEASLSKADQAKLKAAREAEKEKLARMTPEQKEARDKKLAQLTPEQKRDREARKDREALLSDKEKAKLKAERAAKKIASADKKPKDVANKKAPANAQESPKVETKKA